MNLREYDWQGASRQNYHYWVSPFYTYFKETPGNYIYAKETPPGSNRWEAIYIGQSENLSQRLADHEKEAEAIRLGATHIHAHTSSPDEDVRRAEESDLIAGLRPPCNERPGLERVLPRRRSRV